LPPGRVVFLLRQVCSALREAHAAGLIHRDIKPSNILVTRQGGIPDVCKLLDFGLVGEAGDSAAGTEHPVRQGNVLGTPAYMSPEQARGAADEAGPDSDFYSLGATAYFLLTGQPPFGRSSRGELLNAHQFESPVPPDRHRSDLPADLQAVVLRCLE